MEEEKQKYICFIDLDNKEKMFLNNIRPMSTGKNHIEILGKLSNIHKTKKVELKTLEEAIKWLNKKV